MIATHLLNVVRGGLIGLVELVPGVSGGTMALVLGVYETLIVSAGHVLSALRLAVTDLPRGQGLSRAATELGRARWSMVIPILIGMGCALLLLAGLVKGLVHDYPTQSNGLFFGLVLASVSVPIGMVGRAWRTQYVLAAAIFTVVGFVLTGLPPTEVKASGLIIVIAGFVAVSALILPGLSGSFILLTFGMYETTLSAVDDRNLGYLGLFVLGMSLGLATFVKVLQWLLEHRREVTLAILTGLMVGCLRALWPWQDERRGLQPPADDLPSVVGTFLLGVILVAGVTIVARRVATAHEPSREGTVGQHRR